MLKILGHTQETFAIQNFFVFYDRVKKTFIFLNNQSFWTHAGNFRTHTRNVYQYGNFHTHAVNFRTDAGNFEQSERVVS